MQKIKGRRKITRIVLTGGHGATTAIATVQELIKQSSNRQIWDIYWIGPKSAIEGTKIAPLEESFFPRLGVSLRSIITGRLQRRFSIYTIPSLLKIPLGLFMAFRHLVGIKPKVIVSFGGYAAFPVVLAGFLMRIPVLIHEQTITYGRANKFSSIFADKIALARKESIKYFPEEKCVVTGNPIMIQIADLVPKRKMTFPPTLFITGGSRGSLTINNLVKPILPKLLGEFHVIHLVGPMDFRDFIEIKNKLPEALKTKYEVHSQVDPTQMGKFFKDADIVIARAGANTVSEIMVTKIPSILIPIPWSFEDEQTKNALLAKEFGIAKVFDQESLTPEKLLKEVFFMAKNWDYFASRVRLKKSQDIGASSRLVGLIKENI